MSLNLGSLNWSVDCKIKKNKQLKFYMKIKKNPVNFERRKVWSLNKVDEQLKTLKEKSEANKLSIANNENEIEVKEATLVKVKETSRETEEKTSKSLESLNFETNELITQKDQNRADLRTECNNLSKEILRQGFTVLIPVASYCCNKLYSIFLIFKVLWPSEYLKSLKFELC